MRQVIKKLQRNTGFTMVELAITLGILSVVAGTLMLSILTGATIKAQDVTLKRMYAIEEALRMYYYSFYHLPCPAAGDAAFTATAFGTVDGKKGDCDGGSGEVLGTTANATGGGVPVKELNLPDDYALDGWGRRFTYVVDDRFTEVYDSHPAAAALTVRSTSGGAIIDYYPAVLIAYGRNGSGAFPVNGSTVAHRMDTLTETADEDENASLTGAFDVNFVYKAFAPEASGAARFDQVVLPIDLK